MKKVILILYFIAPALCLAQLPFTIKVGGSPNNEDGDSPRDAWNKQMSNNTWLANNSGGGGNPNFRFMTNGYITGSTNFGAFYLGGSATASTLQSTFGSGATTLTITPANASGNISLNGHVFSPSFGSPNFTANTLLVSDSSLSPLITSFPNGVGALTNDGNGVFGWFNLGSIGGGGGGAQTPLAQNVDAAKFSITNANSIEATSFADSGTNAPGERWELNGRAGVVGFPVPYFTPIANNSVIALDIFPHGNPVESSGNGFAWLDIVDRDIKSTNNFAWIRMGARSDAVVIASKVAGTASYKPLIFNMGNSDTDTIDSGGKMGIGNVLPQAKLHVTGSSINGGIYEQATVDSTADVGQLVVDDGTNGNPQLLTQIDTARGLVNIQSAAKGLSFTTQPLTLNKNGGMTLVPNGLGQTTNAAPTSVTVGTTAPDKWVKAYDQTGAAIGFFPVWINH